MVDKGILLFVMAGLTNQIVAFVMSSISILTNYLIKSIRYTSPNSINAIDELLISNVTHLSEDERPQSGWYLYKMCLFIKKDDRDYHTLDMSRSIEYKVYSYSFQNIKHLIEKEKNVRELEIIVANSEYRTTSFRFNMNKFIPRTWQFNAIKDIKENKTSLICGESGIGKTMLGRFLAVELQYRYRLIESFKIGGSTSVVQVVQKYGNKLILVINEIDETFKKTVEILGKKNPSLMGDVANMTDEELYNFTNDISEQIVLRSPTMAKETVNTFLDFVKDLDIYLICTSNVPIATLEKEYPTFTNDHRFKFKLQM
jgi:hypothetical protein